MLTPPMQTRAAALHCQQIHAQAARDRLAKHAVAAAPPRTYRAAASAVVAVVRAALRRPAPAGGPAPSFG